MLQLLDVDMFDARSWSKCQVLVQTFASEVDDLRAFLQTQVQARHLCASKATPNAVVPLRKLRPLQVDAKDCHDGRVCLCTHASCDASRRSPRRALRGPWPWVIRVPRDAGRSRCVVPAARDGAHVSGSPRDVSRSARHCHEARGRPSRVGTAIALIAVVSSFHHAGGGGDCARTDVIGFNHPRLVSFWSAFCHAALLLDTGSNGGKPQSCSCVCVPRA
ncbi:hypothetical protein PsorP6_017061 [Peronosclerospora sorghi]|uniref:Uncharacterized protein n=1 Tax=Peronosclerospora sorghi TaxID=230839 RepID=A0ACC0WEZ0_9STRA|nr:hypothetical protein PsorP6_017061 [Peronosclerospora sorghi]